MSGCLINVSDPAHQGAGWRFFATLAIARRFVCPEKRPPDAPGEISVIGAAGGELGH
jgi:hypothetical protein